MRGGTHTKKIIHKNNMTQEDKQLLLKDLCARLPYGVKCAIFDKKIEFGGFDGRYPFILDGITVETDGVDVWLEKANFSFETIKPYLRPMESMTEEEENEYNSLNAYEKGIFPHTEEAFDWLNVHHFDYRGLIPMGLAIEAPEDMYKTE